MCRPVQLRMNKAQEVAFPWKTSFFLQRMRSAVPCIMQCRLPDTWCFPPFFKETNGKAVRGWLVGQKVK